MPVDVYPGSAVYIYFTSSVAEKEDRGTRLCGYGRDYVTWNTHAHTDDVRHIKDEFQSEKTLCNPAVHLLFSFVL